MHGMDDHPQLCLWDPEALPYFLKRLSSMNLRKSLVATLAIPLLGLAACSQHEDAPQFKQLFPHGQFIV